MTEACGFDSQTGNPEDSDCLDDCLTTDCALSVLGNGECNEACNSKVCGYDWGDCGSCASSCSEGSFGDGACTSQCDVSACLNDFSECSECAIGCTTELLLNDRCDSVCDTVSCFFDNGNCIESISVCGGTCYNYMVNDGHCDVECFEQDACQNDGDDCYCNEGNCHDGMIGNGVCDMACYTAECDYDEGDCGECAYGCFSDMIDDGVCNPECNGQANCDWDGADCGCAYACPIAEYGKCLTTCLNPWCGYDGVDGANTCEDTSLRELALALQLTNRNFDLDLDFSLCPCPDLASPDCSMCNSIDCAYALGNCYHNPCTTPECTTCFDEGTESCLECTTYLLFTKCVDACPIGFTAVTYPFNSGAVCVPEEDTSTEISPRVYYVGTNPTDSYGTGSATDPFATLSIALVSVYTAYSEIRLLGSGPFSLEEVPADCVFAFEDYSDDPLDRSFYPESLKIVPDSGERVELVYADSQNIRFTVTKELTIENVEFVGDLTTDDCQDDYYCNYCPLVTEEDGVFYSDRGQVLNEFLADCSIYSSFNFFTVQPSATLRLNSVSIRDFRMGMASIIDSDRGGNVYLTDVDFKRTVVADSSQDAVIQFKGCTDDYTDCGTLEYIGGQVSYLNDGYELTYNRDCFGFLLAHTMHKAVIRDVSFTFNLVYLTSQALLGELSLLSFSDFYQLEISGCTFTYNYAKSGLITISAEDFELSYSLDDNGTVQELLIDHVTLKNCTFTNNYGEDGGILVASYDTELQNIMVSNLVAKENLVENAALFKIENSAIEEVYKEDGDWILMIDDERTTGFFPKRTTSFVDCKIMQNYQTNEGLFDFSTLTNIVFSRCSITENGPLNGTLNDLLIRVFVEDPGSYIGMFLTDLSSPECSYLGTFSDCYKLTFSECTVADNTCGSQSPALLILDQEELMIEYTDFIRNSGYSEVPVCLDFSGTGDFQIQYSTFSSNTNLYGEGSGPIRVDIGSSLHLSLDSCIAEYNQGSESAFLYHKNSYLSMNNCTFKHNLNEVDSSGCVKLEVTEGVDLATYTITNSTFQSNRATEDKGAAIIVEDDSVGYIELLFIMDNCTFEDNEASTYGSGIVFEGPMTFASGSTISNSKFEDNHGQWGALSFLSTRGSIVISDSWFTNNIESTGVPTLYAISASNLTLVRTTFSSNQGSYIVYLENTESLTTCLLVTQECTFSENQGASIYLSGSQWEDSGSNFTANRHSEGGALLIEAEAVATLTFTNFEANEANYGGVALLRTSSSLSCDYCTFYKNSALYGGGVFYIEQNSEIEAIFSNFSENSGESSSILTALGAPEKQSVLKNCVLHDNYSAIAVMHLILSKLSLQQSELYNHDSYSTISAILSVLEIDESWFHDSTGQDGGAVSGTTSSEITITNSNFTQIENLDDGTIYVGSSTLTVDNCLFQDTEASRGAGIAAYTRSCVYISSSTFDSTVATTSGAVFADDLPVEIRDSVFRNFSMGAITGDYLSALVIDNCQFLDSQNTSLPGIQSSRAGTVSITNSQFSNVVQSGSGGAIQLSSASEAPATQAYTIENCSFEGNSALNGGAIYVYDIEELEIRNCTFVNNTAGAPSFRFDETTIDAGQGGAIYLTCSGIDSCSVTIDSNSFESNTADYNGGAYAWKDSQPTETNNVFASNSAFYGAQVASFAVSYTQISSEGSKRRMGEIGSLEEVAPGQTAEPLYIGLYDHYGELVTTNNVEVGNIIASSTAAVSGTTKATAANGIITFSDYVLNAEPGATGEVIIELSGLSTDETNSISVAFRKCFPGEATVGASCLQCEAGEYSFSTSDTECSVCPDVAVCYGGIDVAPKAGYWRPNKYSNDIWKCLNPDACEGGLETDSSSFSWQGRCAEGYTHNLCHSCADGYSRSQKHECWACPDSEINAIRLLGILIAFLIVLIVIVKLSFRSAYSKKEMHSIYFKIFINYLQLVMLTASFNLSWPDPVLELFAVQETAGTVAEQLFSIDCFLKDSGYSTSDVYYTKLVMITLIPLILGLLALIVWMLYSLLKRKFKYMRTHLIATLAILFFLVHPSIVKVLFSSMNCVELEDGEYWLEDDLAIQCWDSAHVTAVLTVSLPGIIVWGISVPALCWSYLYKHKHMLEQVQLKKRFGFIYNGYYRREYFWEFVILYRKILIISCAVFLDMSVPIQALTVLLVLLGFLWLQLVREPYAETELNTMEVRSILVSAVTIYCGLYFLTKDLDEGGRMFFFLLILVFNIYFLISWIVKTFRAALVFIGTKIGWVRRNFLRGVRDGFDDDLFHVEEKVDHIQGKGRDKHYSLVRSVPEERPAQIPSLVEFFSQSIQAATQKAKAQLESPSEDSCFEQQLDSGGGHILASPPSSNSSRSN